MQKYNNIIKLLQQNSPKLADKTEFKAQILQEIQKQNKQPKSVLFIRMSKQILTLAASVLLLLFVWQEYIFLNKITALEQKIQSYSRKHITTYKTKYYAVYKILNPAENRTINHKFMNQKLAKIKFENNAESHEKQSVFRHTIFRFIENAAPEKQ